MVKWNNDKARQLTRQANHLLADHTHGAAWDKLARDNCGACALACTATSAPNYAGWLRVYLQAGLVVPRAHYDTEMAEATRDNELYRDAILTDIETYGINFERT